MKARIEFILRQFPEAKWDRWAGNHNDMVVFGWIGRPDGRTDFLLLRIVAGAAIELATSSARYSEEFSQRLGLPHTDCRKIADDFDITDAATIKTSDTQIGSVKGGD